ncbi:phage baseplate upper protein, partial [Listeria monocytogenes]|nr:phage baseplate upper protein [Listeria monocytogenes]EAH2317491.1 phage baseplate upper protein [Listeria monocytogenes]
MTNKIFKSAILDFSVSAQNAKANVPQIRFSTQDSGGTARLVFAIKKEDYSLPLSSAAEITLAMVMSVGEEYESKYVVNPVITNRAKGIFEYSLTDDQISHNGQVNAELYVKYPEQAMQINRFNFEIEKAMIDDNFFPVATYYVERWDNYEKIFDESVAELSNKLEALDVRADNIQTQFDSFSPEQFTPKEEFENHIYNSDIHVTIANKIAWESKETMEGSQAKADRALADAKTFFELSSSVQSVTLTPKNGFVASQPLVARYIKFGNRFLVIVSGIVGKGTGNGTGICATLPTFLAPDASWNKLYSAAQQST